MQMPDGTMVVERWAGTYGLYEGKKVGYPAVILNLIEELSRAEAQLAALQWQPITPESRPRAGDEVAEYVYATVDEPDYWIVSEVDFEGGWSSVATHFRPINPPAKEASDVPAV